ncbi:hypothetical protein LEP1GSC116_3884 [Leptospira interrogans serovar Icterohaemorrhagiae str. Verdun HP]|uniref:Uncharacterized protein n=1 Tax=Leptospira interrogans serovar Icterohaemorrhagiae str. Verdun HP TaxID=1049910 RepID=M6RHQ1_LEPIR|nr:hypothetical protein LEP1GSC116_3884 [Leptospira interrogans serovar Icterohaemorrhagiae str. Verdun HP]
MNNVDLPTFCLPTIDTTGIFFPGSLRGALIETTSSDFAISFFTALAILILIFAVVH